MKNQQIYYYLPKKTLYKYFIKTYNKKYKNALEE